jgi:hypothetical protein
MDEQFEAQLNDFKTDENELEEVLRNTTWMSL